ncbi:aspartate aminotransferase family protein [Allostreptomyces psammosilenae]|uniref:Diaminobutyrate--2-oxoglutarate transaminase n=1 Tax=Allostreptomyces psammosilenae TaxID=1892865 RepID=A0A853A954_9ACTN|nr:aspartate aminotransferase family protein [Allostreptomyces psammosilenae]NYI06952.1 diaminobutyrate-2-oxoglutarate transaminase [Allostreptomyces psammosilenae]
MTTPLLPDAAAPPHGAPSDTAVFERHESDVRLYSRKFPVVFTHGHGSWLVSEDGRRYLDFFCGASALNYGHNPPEAKERLIEYLSRDGLVHGLDMYTAAKRAFLARFHEVIAAPHGLPHKVQFCGPTGTDAVEAALKLARKATGRRTVVAFTGAFHGMSRGSLSVTGSRRARAAGGVDLQDVLFVPYEDGPAGAFDSVDYLERLLADPAGGVDPPAAVIVEPVQVDGGVYPASARWLRRLRAFTERWGALLIADDIQAGCGRSGDFFSFTHAGVTPDLITLSKSISGYGLPLSLLLIAPGLDVWQPGEHTGTFRGNQLAFVSATATLELWTRPEFTARVAENQRVLQEEARRLAAGRPGVTVRGRGMLAGLDVGDPGRAERVQGECFRRGLILELCGRNDRVVKLMPALNIGEEDLRTGIDVLRSALEATA